MAAQVSVTMKQIRILSNGMISTGDRETHTTKDPNQGGPDRVQWIALGGGPFTIRFEQSPFQPGPQDIAVPPSNPQTVSEAIGRYKYSVLDAAGNVVDDPDVIIE